MSNTLAVHRNISCPTTGDTEVVGINPMRSYLLIVNDSDTDMYLNLGGPAVVNQGIRINNSGGSYEINSTNLFKGRVCAICSAASKKLLITEW